jgi:hypothetical protein
LWLGAIARTLDSSALLRNDKQRIENGKNTAGPSTAWLAKARSTSLRMTIVFAMVKAVATALRCKGKGKGEDKDQSNSKSKATATAKCSCNNEYGDPSLRSRMTTFFVVGT